MSIINDDLLIRAIKREGKIIDLKIRHLEDGGVNYAGKIFFVNFVLNTQETCNEIHNLVIKLPDYDSFFGSLNKQFKCVQKEIFIYTRLSADIVNFQQKMFELLHLELPLPEVIYGDEVDEVLILENLSVSGYLMKDRVLGHSYNECVCVVESLALFHGLNWAYMKSFDSESEYILKHPYVLGDWWKLSEQYLTREDYIFSKQNTFELILHFLETHYPDEKELFADVKLYLQKTPIPANARYFYEQCEGFNVLCHGDTWGNNILIKYDDSTPLDGKFIDFQLTKYCSPAADLSQYIWSAANNEVILNHIPDLLSNYYAKLKSVCVNFDYKFEFIKDQLVEKFKQLNGFQFQFQLSSIVHAYAPKTNAYKPNVEKSNLFSEEFVDDFFKFANNNFEKLPKQTAQRMMCLIRCAKRFNVF